MSRFPTMELQPTGLDHSSDANSTKPGPRMPSRVTGGVAGAGASSRSPGPCHDPGEPRVARTHRLRGGRGFALSVEGQQCFKLQIEEDAPRRHGGHGECQPVILNRPSTNRVGGRVAGAGVVSRSPGFSHVHGEPRGPSTSRVARTHRLRGGRDFVPGCEGQHFKLQIENCKLKSEKGATPRVAGAGAASRSPGDGYVAGEPQVTPTSRVARTHRLRGGRGFVPACLPDIGGPS